MIILGGFNAVIGGVGPLPNTGDPEAIEVAREDFVSCRDLKTKFKDINKHMSKAGDKDATE
ncbi:MAG: hypothetical protein AAFZ91_07320 [Pseudomonadota bacterium]